MRKSTGKNFFPHIFRTLRYFSMSHLEDRCLMVSGHDYIRREKKISILIWRDRLVCATRTRKALLVRKEEEVRPTLFHNHIALSSTHPEVAATKATLSAVEATLLSGLNLKSKIETKSGSTDSRTHYHYHILSASDRSNTIGSSHRTLKDVLAGCPLRISSFSYS